MAEQYVCTVCGYNMIDFHPHRCPFCGAAQDHFLTAVEVAKRYRVVKTRVTDRITMLRSEPALGFEHAAYQLDSGSSTCWIDCPSTFDSSLDPVDSIFYTHEISTVCGFDYTAGIDEWLPHFNRLLAENPLEHASSGTAAA